MRHKVIFSLQGWIVALGDFKSLEYQHDPDLGYEVHLQLDNIDKKVLEVMIGMGYFYLTGSERMHMFPAPTGGHHWHQTCTILVRHQTLLSIISLSHHYADIEVSDNEVYIHAYGQNIKVMDMKVADNDY